MESSILTAEKMMNRIALEMRGEGKCSMRAPNNFWTGCSYEIHISITSDVCETEYDFTQRYGSGYSFNFSLSCYEEGKNLAGQLYKKIKKIDPDMSAYSVDSFKRSDLLSLVAYICNINIKTQYLLPIHHYNIPYSLGHLHYLGFTCN